MIVCSKKMTNVEMRPATDILLCTSDIVCSKRITNLKCDQVKMYYWVK